MNENRAVFGDRSRRQGRGPGRGRAKRGSDSETPASATRRYSDSRGRKMALMPILVIVGLMIPGHFTFNLFDAVMTPIRVILILCFVPAVLNFLKHRGRLMLGDYAFFGFVGWTALCILINRGTGGIERAGQFVLETGLVYTIFRGSLVNYAGIERVTRFLAWSGVIFMLLAVPEWITNSHWTRDQLNALFGTQSLHEQLAGERFGIIRAASIFSHPILFGVICASLPVIIWYSEPNKMRRNITAGGCLAGVFMSLSSGAFVAFGVQFACALVEKYSRWLKGRFLIIGGAIASALLAIQFISNRGLFAVVVLLSLNPATAYYRRNIWDFGIDDVQRNPIFGMRPEEWTRLFWMTPSIDNFWLYRAMEGGFPAVILLVLANLLLIHEMFRHRSNMLPRRLAAYRFGIAFTLLGLACAGGTVHFFGKMQPFYIVMIALGAAAARVAGDVAAETAEPKRKRNPGLAVSGPEAEEDAPKPPPEPTRAPAHGPGNAAARRTARGRLPVGGSGPVHRR